MAIGIKKSQSGEKAARTSNKPVKWKDAEYHKKEILNIINNIEDSWILWQMHRFAINMTKED